MTSSDAGLRTFAGLRRIVARLRSTDGCPWDKVQTHESLRPYLLEESSEVLSALDSADPSRLQEELGDLLFQVLIHIQIAQEQREFRLADVIESIGAKLVRRHPHVFGDAIAETPEAVVEQWDDLKRSERGDNSALTGIPEALPALAYAQSLQARASRAGFAFDSVDQAWQALEEELEELRRAETAEERTEELGDTVFALANLARWYEVESEDALRSTCRGFSRRFQRMEALAAGRNLDLRSLPTEEKLALWEEANAGANP